MNNEEALEFVDELVFLKTGNRLKNNQRNVFKGSWENIDYEKIHKNYSFTCSYDHLERNIGPQLWTLLKSILGEDVSKKNLNGPVEAAWRKKHSPSNLGQDERETLLLTPILDGENPASPPSPLANPELPKGRVPLGSHFYIERHVESLCYEKIRLGELFVRIKAPQEMGKTSVLERILAKLKQEYQIVNLSFKTDSTVFSNLYKFSRYFCACVTKQLKMDNQLDNYWDEDLGYNENVTNYFEEYLLA